MSASNSAACRAGSLSLVSRSSSSATGLRSRGGRARLYPALRRLASTRRVVASHDHDRGERSGDDGAGFVALLRLRSHGSRDDVAARRVELRARNWNSTSTRASTASRLRRAVDLLARRHPILTATVDRADRARSGVPARPRPCSSTRPTDDGPRSVRGADVPAGASPRRDAVTPAVRACTTPSPTAAVSWCSSTTSARCTPRVTSQRAARGRRRLERPDHRRVARPRPRRHRRSRPHGLGRGAAVGGAALDPSRRHANRTTTRRPSRRATGPRVSSRRTSRRWRPRERSEGGGAITCSWPCSPGRGSTPSGTRRPCRRSAGGWSPSTAAASFGASRGVGNLSGLEPVSMLDLESMSLPDTVDAVRRAFARLGRAGTGMVADLASAGVRPRAGTAARPGRSAAPFELRAATDRYTRFYSHVDAFPDSLATGATRSWSACAGGRTRRARRRTSPCSSPRFAPRPRSRSSPRLRSSRPARARALAARATELLGELADEMSARVAGRIR